MKKFLKILTNCYGPLKFILKRVDSKTVFEKESLFDYVYSEETYVDAALLT